MIVYQKFLISSILVLCIKFKLRWFIIAKELLVNEKIGNKTVRVVNADGPIGVMSGSEALQIALQEGLDFNKMKDAMHSHFNPEKLRASLDPAKLKAAMQKAKMTDVGAFIKLAIQKGFIEKLKR